MSMVTSNPYQAQRVKSTYIVVDRRVSILSIVMMTWEGIPHKSTYRTRWANPRPYLDLKDLLRAPCYVFLTYGAVLIT